VYQSMSEHAMRNSARLLLLGAAVALAAPSAADDVDEGQTAILLPDRPAGTNPAPPEVQERVRQLNEQANWRKQPIPDTIDLGPVAHSPSGTAASQGSARAAAARGKVQPGRETRGRAQAAKRARGPGQSRRGAAGASPHSGGRPKR
jgi:hypothetical protein